MNLCDLRNLNQGGVECDFELGVPDYVIFAPKTAKIKESDARNLLSFLQEKAYDADPLQRFYPVKGEVKRITDESTEPTVGSLDKGYSKQLLPGRAIYLFEWPSSVCSDRNIVKLNRYSGGAFIINSDGLLIGVRDADGNMAPLPVDVSVWGGGFSGSGGDLQTIRMRLDFGNQIRLLSNAMAYKLREQENIETLTGIRDVQIVVVSKTAGVAIVKAVTGCDNVNLFGRLTKDDDTDILSTTEGWLVNGEEPAAVQENATDQTYSITLDGGSFENISIASTNTLVKSSILGFEGVITYF